jgi:hypothetical protein
MKVTIIPSSVLGGQGSIGSGSLSVPNAAPGVGPINGEMGNDDVVVSIANPGNDNFSSEADEAFPMHLDGGIQPMATPAPSPVMATHPPGGNEPMSQYSTQGPIPKG